MGSSDLLDVAVATRGAGVVVTVRGELDLATAPILREQLSTVDKDAARVVVDLSAVTFIGSAGLALLVEAHNECAGRGASLAVVATGTVVPRAIEITSLDEVFEVHPTAEAALGS